MKVARQFIAWNPCENGSRPVDRALRDGFFIERVPGNKLPGYDHRVPPGRAFSSKLPAFGADYYHSVPSGQNPN